MTLDSIYRPSLVAQLSLDHKTPLAVDKKVMVQKFGAVYAK